MMPFRKNSQISKWIVPLKILIPNTHLSVHSITKSSLGRDGILRRSFTTLKMIVYTNPLLRTMSAISICLPRITQIILQDMIALIISKRCSQLQAHKDMIQNLSSCITLTPKLQARSLALQDLLSSFMPLTTS